MQDEEELIEMKPELGDEEVRIPTTFTYRGGSDENEKEKIITVLVTVVALIVLLLILWTGERGVVAKVVYSVVYISIGLGVIEKFVIKKKYYLEVTNELESSNYIFDSRKFWSVYTIDKEYPHICYFKNGEIGIFIKMEKDIALGNEEEFEYNHYEAISDALWSIGRAKGKIKIRHIDVMGNIGSDERINRSIEELRKSKSDALRLLYTDIFSSLREECSDKYECDDIYLLRGRVRPDILEKFAMNFIAILLEGNYVSYTVAGSRELRKLAVDVMNLNDFSAIDACNAVKNTSIITGITPIYSIDVNGERIVYNRTSEEKNQEKIVKRKEKLAKSTKKKIEDEKISLSDADK